MDSGKLQLSMDREKKNSTFMSTWFISAYDIGLSGAEATWANKRYRHRTLPPIMLAEVRQAQIDMPAPPM